MIWYRGFSYSWKICQLNRGPHFTIPPGHNFLGIERPRPPLSRKWRDPRPPISQESVGPGSQHMDLGPHFCGNIGTQVPTFLGIWGPGPPLFWEYGDLRIWGPRVQSHFHITPEVFELYWKWIYSRTQNWSSARPIIIEDLKKEFAVLILKCGILAWQFWARLFPNPSLRSHKCLGSRFDYTPVKWRHNWPLHFILKALHFHST